MLAFTGDSGSRIRDVPISAFAWRLEQGGIDPFSANSQKSEPELAVQELDSSLWEGERQNKRQLATELRSAEPRMGLRLTCRE